ncbi:MAG: dihydroorotase [Candidatus Omnitrophica bacterium]|nr:dihydroorotase [Candidatus Omnitrophota bacterium]
MRDEGILIKHGRVIDPANKIDQVLDILVEDARISRVAKEIKVKADTVIEAKGKIVMPGLVDMHVHLREPGREDKETIETGTRASLKGGVTSLLAMPNTIPAIDSADNVKLIKEIIKKTAQVNVFISGAITKGRLGRELTDIARLKAEGVVAITDDGVSVDDETLFSEALKEAKVEDMLVVCHCEDKALSGKGVVNRGIVATRTGLRGISNESEFARVERDIRLAQKTGSRIHIAHVSCRESVEKIAQAKKEGIKVTAETCPHYFALSEECVLGYDTNFKMNPPLRSKDDVEAVKEGLKNGTIDAISSDHAPHTENEKDIEFDRAEFGVIGLQTELAVAISELVETKVLDWLTLAEKMSLNPAKILGINKGTLGEGQDADIIIIDPRKEWVVKKEGFLSRSKNSAFLGRSLKGVVTHTICSGNLCFTNGK